jgi:hypothetical protein
MRLTHWSRRCSGGANNSGNYWLICFRNSSTSSSAQWRRTVRRLARGRRMTGTPKLPLQLSALPDWAVLTDQQTSGVLGLSLDTASASRQASRRASQVDPTARRRVAPRTTNTNGRRPNRRRSQAHQLSTSPPGRKASIQPRRLGSDAQTSCEGAIKN